MPISAPTLIFDGDCGFCGRALSWGQRHLTAFPRAIASQSEEAKAAGLTQAQLEESIWIIGAGQPIAAAKAAAFILKLQPNILWRTLGWLMSVWPFSSIAKLVYFWVAKNRGKW
jgi:predicted DCC family thiol-disulfide oxidoreductase YuxK